MSSNLQDIETQDRAALTAHWMEVFATPAPKRLSQPFMRRFLAFERQARAEGGMPKSLRKALERLATTPKGRKTPSLKPGGRLVREWNGVTHVVDVVEDGFLWQDTHYRSLSAIACAITGAHWSGPRFFGLRTA